MSARLGRFTVPPLRSNDGTRALVLATIAGDDDLVGERMCSRRPP